MSLLGAICISKSLFVLFCGGDRPYDFHATVEQAVDEFKKILQPAIARVIHIEKYQNGIPQFYVGHQHVLAHIKQFERANPRYKIKGNFVSGVAVGDCLSV